MTNVYSISSVMDTSCIPIQSRKDLVSARKNFFQHVLALFDSSANESASETMREWGMHIPIPPHNDDIMQNPHRGWLIIRSNITRPYTISVWQSGRWIRIGLSVEPSTEIMKVSWDELMKDIFYNSPPHATVRGNTLLYDWHFETPNFFDSLQEQETWVMAIHHLYAMTADIINRSKT